MHRWLPVRQRYSDSSSSSCLSLLSESDFLDEPSTSGCSSEMASHMQSREKKRRKVKAFLKELKAMVPYETSGSKPCTLSTLDYVISSMRKITEEQKQEKGQVLKASSSEPVALPSLQCPELVDFRNANDGIDLTTKSDLTVAVSLKNHVVLHTSAALMDLLGYPHAWWKGRLLKDFVHKKDIMTVNSYINSETSDTSSSESRNQHETKDSPRSQQQFFYARFRQFRSLSSVFSLASSGSYMFFKVMVISKPAENITDASSEQQKISKRCMMLYFAPMTSPYKDYQLPDEPEQRVFSLRHSLFCTYTYTHANVVPLLGFLPQDIVGTSIFDYYHPDDLPQLLDMYRKVMQSTGQPFKSGPLRLLTRNGTYLMVTTELSSFMNPWDYKLEFIIAQHTVIKPPENPNVFEEGPEALDTAESKMSNISRNLVRKITEVLQKPAVLDTRPPTPSDSWGGGSSPPTGMGLAAPDNDKKKESGKDEGFQGQTSVSEMSSSDLDVKSISSLYRQVNYSLNIRKFLLSHPKAFPVSDESSSVELAQKDDSEDLNEEMEVQVEIPVCQTLSCGSSAQVHVSEPGIHEEVPGSPQSFSGEDPMLTQDTIDSQLCLTEDSLRKHTKAQELIYLQEAQPHLLHLKSRQQARQRSRQKRSVPCWHEEPTNVFKFARNSRGQRRNGNGGAAGIFMSKVPISGVDVKSSTAQPANSTRPTTSVPKVVGVMPGSYQLGMMSQLTMLPVNPSAGLPHLQSVISRPSTGMHWPFYPQSNGGYSLMPQVMAGFYQPMLQPVPMTSEAPPVSDTSHGATSSTGNSAHQQQMSDEQQKSGVDSDNTPSAEETGSSMQFLLDAMSASSPNEEPEGKLHQRDRHLQSRKSASLCRRSVIPPWLQGVNWSPEVRLTYKLPHVKKHSVLRKDREALKKMRQSQQVKLQLQTILEEVESQDYLPAINEEADYIFYPEPSHVDAVHMYSETTGDNTPQGNCSPTAVHGDSGEKATCETELSGVRKATDSDQDTAASGSSVTDYLKNVEQAVEVTISELPPRFSHNDVSEKLENIPESAEKTVSPHSKENSPVTKTEGGDGVESTNISPACDASMKSSKNEDVMLETESPKYGAGSDDGRSDVGSDRGSEHCSNNSQQKNEDVLSSSSHVSSNLTPSDKRSMEDAGSSWKESDTSPPKDSTMSSFKVLSTDSESESSTATPRPDILEKLFVPLKVLMCEGKKVRQPNMVMSLPFWQQEACMSEEVAMTYNLCPPDLAAILASDRRRLATMGQPMQVTCQLLEMLQDNQGTKRSEGSSSVMPKHRILSEENGQSMALCAEAMDASSPMCSSDINSPEISTDANSKASVSCKEKEESDPTDNKAKPDAACINRQLKNVLHNLTPGNLSDDWPGDIIMSEVFLPYNLMDMSTPIENTESAQDTKIKDEVE